MAKNIKQKMQHELLVMYQRGKGQKHCMDPNNENIHSRNTVNTYLKQVKPYADWLEKQGVKKQCSLNEAASHVQDYIDELVASGGNPNTIHTRVAAICKALGRKMSEYKVPPRKNAPTKGRAPAPSLKGRQDADLNNMKHQRLVQFARAVGIRRREYAALNGRDYHELPDGYGYVFVSNGKGGKRQMQRIAPADMAFVRGYFNGVDADALIFSKEEMKNKLNLHGLRREHAQEMYRMYMSRLATEPGYREQLTNELKQAFERAGEDWRSNPDMGRLDKPYYVRGNVRKDMEMKHLNAKYDRLATMAVSVFHLSHWRSGVTVRNYFR